MIYAFLFQNYHFVYEEVQNFAITFEFINGTVSYLFAAFFIAFYHQNGESIVRFLNALLQFEERHVLGNGKT